MLDWWLQRVPILEWAPRYNKSAFASDVIAALIVTVMLIPQSLAYALLAGLPVQVGLYASIAPLLVYAVFGTSRSLSVGPVAIISLMTAASIGKVVATGLAGPLEAAILLAFLSGVMLLVLGLFRLGFLANFLSHPVISGFITASAVVIAFNQLGNILGIKTGGHGLPELVMGLWEALPQTNWPTLAVGLHVLVFLIWLRVAGSATLQRLGLSKGAADISAKAGPILAVVASTLAVGSLGLEARGVAIVGAVPSGLPTLALPNFNMELMGALFVPALLISLVGFVESISVAQTLGAKKRQSVDPDQELVGLGFSNLASGISGGYPVTGGIARSVVNFDAGASTQAAGAYAGLGIAVATLFLTPALYYLPKATLAATIVIAVLSLADFKALARTWHYSKADGGAMAATLLATLAFGAELGITVGIAVSLALYLYRTSRPHMAVVGCVPGTEHYRNIKRHTVRTCPQIVILRVDESLYFANARYLEDEVARLVKGRPEVKDFILACPAVNFIDASALESLEFINSRLSDGGIRFHLAEVKGPVMDRLGDTHFLQNLTGQVFLSLYQAEAQLTHPNDVVALIEED